MGSGGRRAGCIPVHKTRRATVPSRCEAAIEGSCVGSSGFGGRRRADCMPVDTAHRAKAPSGREWCANDQVDQ